MQYDPKNLLADFARRTLANLEHIDRVAEAEDSRDLLPERRTAFPVTQIINSLLGLVVFPKEEYGKDIEEKKLAQLLEEGWPDFEIFYPSPSCSKDGQKNHKRCETLHDLIRVLRNGASHFNVVFRNDRTEQISRIELSNRCPQCKKLTTTVRLTTEQVREIAERYSRLIIDYSEKKLSQPA